MIDRIRQILDDRTDAQLLQAYARTRDEKAFEAIVGAGEQHGFAIGLPLFTSGF